MTEMAWNKLERGWANNYGELRVGAHRAAPIMACIWIDQGLKEKMNY